MWEPPSSPTRSPEFEHRRTIASDHGFVKEKQDFRAAEEDRHLLRGGAGSAHEERDWKEAEKLAGALSLAESPSDEQLPLVAICGRPNVGKSTLFNRLTGSRRSIVGDEPGITRDRIYGEIEWAGREARLVDTGGVVPDDEALIPSEIFRQARVAPNTTSLDAVLRLRVKAQARKG